MTVLSQEQINSDLFDQIIKMKKEKASLKEELSDIHELAVKGLMNGDISALEDIRNKTEQHTYPDVIVFEEGIEV